MATFKSNSRTVLNTSISSSSSYSSGQLFVGDLSELTVGCTVSSATIVSGDIRLNFSRILPDGNAYVLNWLTLNTSGSYTLDVGPGVDSNTNNAVPIGDTIQLDLSVSNGGNSVSTTICIIGK